MDRLGIVNKALLKLGQTPVANLEDTDNRVVSILAIYESVRDTEQTSYRWTFCTKRFILEPIKVKDAEGNVIVVAPKFGYKYQYLLPKGFLRLISIYEHTQTGYSIEGQRLLTNLEGPLKIIALCIEEHECNFPPAFVEAFSTKLAIEVCKRIEQDVAEKAQLMQEYLMALSIAKKTDAIQRATEKPVEGPWVDVRFSEVPTNDQSFRW